MCGSGSTSLLNMDPIRIRIHNSGYSSVSGLLYTEACFSFLCQQNVLCSVLYRPNPVLYRGISPFYTALKYISPFCTYYRSPLYIPVYNFPTFISWEVLFLGLFSETHWHICKLNRNSIEFLEYGLFLANSFNYWGYFSQSNLPTFILVIIFFFFPKPYLLTCVFFVKISGSCFD